MVASNKMEISSIYWNVACSVISWSTLYFILARNNFYKQSAEFFCRIVTVAHALVAVTLSFGCYWQGPDPYKYPGEDNTRLQDLTLGVSLGYFLFDLGWCLYHQTETATMILHHMVSVVSITTVLVERTSGGEAVAGILSLEITNPLLQLRWFLRTAGYRGTLAHRAVELMFFAAFLFMRLGFGTILTYRIAMSNKVKTNVKLCSLSLYFISIVFIFYMFQYVTKKYYNKKIYKSD